MVCGQTSSSGLCRQLFLKMSSVLELIPNPHSHTLLVPRLVLSSPLSCLSVGCRQTVRLSSCKLRATSFSEPPRGGRTTTSILQHSKPIHTRPTCSQHRRLANMGLKTVFVSPSRLGICAPDACIAMLTTRSSSWQWPCSRPSSTSAARSSPCSTTTRLSACPG